MRLAIAPSLLVTLTADVDLVLFVRAFGLGEVNQLGRGRHQHLELLLRELLLVLLDARCHLVAPLLGKGLGLLPALLQAALELLGCHCCVRSEVFTELELGQFERLAPLTRHQLRTREREVERERARGKE